MKGTVMGTGKAGTEGQTERRQVTRRKGKSRPESGKGKLGNLTGNKAGKARCVGGNRRRSEPLRAGPGQFSQASPTPGGVG